MDLYAYENFGKLVILMPLTLQHVLPISTTKTIISNYFSNEYSKIGHFHHTIHPLFTASNPAQMVPQTSTYQIHALIFLFK